MWSVYLVIDLADSCVTESQGYCSSQCQRDHWREHRAACGAARQAKKAGKPVPTPAPAPVAASPAPQPVPKVELSENKIELKEDVKFHGGKADIKDESFGLLREVKDLMMSRPGLEIEVGGHTADVGDSAEKDALELQLSEDRASAVRTWLVTEGVEEHRVTAVGYGDTRPVASNDTPEGRAKNRRVEFVVTKQVILIVLV